MYWKNRRISFRGWLLLVCGLLLVLSAIDPVLIFRRPGTEHFLIIDTSASIGDDALAQALNEVRRLKAQDSSVRIIVSGEVPVESSFDELGTRIKKRVSGTGTSLAATLDYAAALRSGKNTLMTVFTDSGETFGDLPHTVAKLAADGVKLHFKTFSDGMMHEITLLSCRTGVNAMPGENLPLTVKIASEADADATLVINNSSSGKEYSHKLKLFAGIHDYELSAPRTVPGLNILDIRLISGADTVRDNNYMSAALWVNSPYKVLLLSDNPDYDGEALRRLLGDTAEIVFNSGTSFDDVALTVVSGKIIEELPREQASALTEAVKLGMGLLVFTGQSSPVLKEGQGIPEICLPVNFEDPGELRHPSVSLAIIIDTSGSMGGGRIDLAREIARAAIGKLRDFDKAGIVEFHGARRWAAPLQSAANHLELDRALNRLNAGGGTVMLPAFKEAMFALRNCDSRLKHVLVLTDGGVENGPFEKQIRDMTAHGITLSTVMVGPGRHSRFLSQLAQWGGGRYYHAGNRFSIPELIFRQSGNTRYSSILEGSLNPARGSRVFPVEDISAFPPLRGMIRARLKPTADSVLTVGSEALPLLAFMRYGLGGSAVMTAGLSGKWTSELYADPRFKAALTAFARKLPDASRIDAFMIDNQSRNRRMELLFRLPDNLHGDDELNLKLYKDDELCEQLTLFAESPGVWRLVRENIAPGVYYGVISSGSFSSRTAFSIYPEPELNRPDGGAEMIAALNTSASAAFKGRSDDTLIRHFSLRIPLGIAALMLLLAQLVSSRLSGIGGGARYAIWLLMFAMLSAPLYAVGTHGNDQVWLEILSSGKFSAATLPDNREDYGNQLLRGVLFWSRNDYVSASACFQRAAAVAARASDRRFALLFELESYRRAEKEDVWLKTALKSSDADVISMELLVAALEDRGSYAQALKIIQKFFDEGGEKSSMLVHAFIRLAEKSGNKDLAGNFFRQSVAENPKDLALHLAWSRFELLQLRREVAETVLLDFVVRCNDVTVLTELAGAASILVMDKVMYGAIDKADELDPEGVAQRKLFVIKHLYRRGKVEDAFAELDKMAEKYRQDRPTLIAVMELYDRWGKPEIALRICMGSPGFKDSDELLIKAAMLADEFKDPEPALSLWTALAARTDNIVRAEQATERVIELAYKKGTLAQFYKELELRTDEPAAFRQFVAVCCRTKRHKALFEHISKRDDIAGLAYGLQVMAAEGQLEYAMKLLDILKRKDPQGVREYLQHQAVIAVEMKNEPMLNQTLEELSRLPGEPIEILELSGGIAAMAGNHAAAEKYYRQCLQLAPDKVELYLSWAESLKAQGRVNEALELFESRLNKDLSADEFGVMVDGILSFDDSFSRLPSLTAAIDRRLAAEPDNIFYHRLAEDVAEERKDMDKWNLINLLSLVFAPEQRTFTLRKMFDLAVLAGNEKDMLSWGMMLCGSGELTPVDIYTVLGRKLTGAGRFSAAERIFVMADESNDGDVSSRLAMSNAWRDAGKLGDAERMLRELLILDPDNMDLSISHAAMLELHGRYSEAAAAYLQPLTILMSQRETGARARDHERSIERQMQTLARAVVNCRSMTGEKIDAKVFSLLNKSGEKSQPKPKPEPEVLLLLNNDLTGAAEYIATNIDALQIPKDRNRFEQFTALAVCLRLQSLIDTVALKWLEQALASGDASVVSCLNLAKGSVSEATHKQMNSMLIAGNEHLDAQGALALLRFCDAASLDKNVLDVCLNKVLSKKRMTQAEITELLNLIPQSERSRVFLAAIQSIPEAQRRRIIRNTLSNIEINAGDDSRNAIVKVFKNAPPERHLWTSGESSNFNSSLRTALVEILLAEQPESIDALVLAAISRNQSGDFAGARVMGNEIIERIIAETKVDHRTLANIDWLAEIFGNDRQDELRETIDDLKMFRMPENNNQTLDMIIAIFEKRAGNVAAAFSSAAASWKADVNNHSIFRRLNELAATGASSEERYKLLVPRRPADPVASLFFDREICALQLELGLYAEARASATRLSSYFQAQEVLRADALTNDVPAMKRNLLRFFIAMRNEGRSYPLRGNYKSIRSEQEDRSMNFFATLSADFPLRDELEYMLLGAEPDSRFAAAVFAALRASNDAGSAIPEGAAAYQDLNINAKLIRLSRLNNPADKDVAVIIELLKTKLNDELRLELTAMLPPERRIGPALAFLGTVRARRQNPANQELIRSIMELLSEAP
jgi:tetratricopeptide (TPR) repeat protein